MPGLFDSVRALRPGRSAFNLSYDKKFTCDLGQLIPVLAEEVVPGDTWKIGIEAVVRFMPMVAPILHEINMFVHYFFVPYRLLSTDWEAFITGGADGQDNHTMPVWTPTGGNVTNDDGTVVADNGVGSLWDFFGFPVGVVPTGVLPLAFPRAAYNRIWNEYFRDETLQTEIALTSSVVKNRAWEKDFFTSANPWQQRGIAPALPVTIGGSASPTWATDIGVQYPAVTANNATAMQFSATDFHPFNAGTLSALQLGTVSKNALGAGVVAGSGFTATTFNVSDLRLAFQIQKWMERNARGGARYTEFLMNHFGVAPRDERLQRAEYIGGTRMPVIVSEVLQTSASVAGQTPQATMAGHGLVAGRDFCASYRAQEYGIVMGIMSIMPRTAYSQGVNRQWLRATRYDYYSPEWAHLSEQAVQKGELYATAVQADNIATFGYQGRFNEMRSKQSMTCSLMRYGVANSLAFWHLARNFGALPALNESFIRCVPRKDYLAVPAQPAVIVNVANMVKAVRPMPIESDPGLIDHS